MIGKSLDIGSSVIRFFSKNFYTLILFALVLISAFSSIWLFYFEIVKDTNPLSSIPAHIVTEKSAKRAEAAMVAGDRYLVGFCLFSYFSFGAGYKIETV